MSDAGKCASVSQSQFHGLSFNNSQVAEKLATAHRRAATVHVMTYGFNSAGWTETVTDPRGLVGKTLYDNLGRTTKRIENFTGSGVPDDDYPNQNKTVEFGYDGANHLTSYKAWLDDPSGTSNDKYQETGYLYGVSVGDGNYLTSNDVLVTEQYPDKSTGAPSTSSADKVTYKLNALGQRIAMTDRNGNVHAYSFDAVGRPTKDAVTTLGSGVDGAVRRIETAYDSAGRAYLFTSYSAASPGTIVNQVQRTFNGLGQITEEAQGHTSAGAGNDRFQYGYDENGNRLYKDVVMAGTGSSDSYDELYHANGATAGYDKLNQLTEFRRGKLSDTNSDGVMDTVSTAGRTQVWAPDPLGNFNTVTTDGTATTRTHNRQSGVDLTYITASATSSDSQDQYTGLDRFNRIVDQKWGVGSTDIDRFQYGYDENGNRLYKDVVMAGTGLSDSYDELYHANGATAGYDSLNQFTESHATSVHKLS